MGLLRVYLALCVFEWHFNFSPYPVFIFSFSAVLCFFIISGFLMSWILNQKYDVSTRAGLIQFYVNRALRIYPIWALIVIVAVIAGHLHFVPLSDTFSLSAPLPILQRLYNIVCQFTLLPPVLYSNVMLHPGFQGSSQIIYGQMYTVGLEIMFYMLAPFIVRRSTPVLVVVTVIAGLYHYNLARVGFSPRPWQYEFFPGIVYFFLLGSVAYRVYAVIKDLKYPYWAGVVGWPIIAYAAYHVRDISVGAFTDDRHMAVFYIVVALIIPFLFNSSKSKGLVLDKVWKADRIIGDLSYPIYAVQYFIAALFGIVPGSTDKAADTRMLIATVLAGAVIMIAVEWPMERIRRNVAKNRSEPRAHPTGIPAPVS